MKKENWVWMPHPGHLCVSERCRFHLNTYVGGYVVSTLGEYYQTNNSIEPTEIGAGRLYETMVFRAQRSTMKCCPWMADIVGGELDMRPYNSAGEAFAGHLKMCRKYSGKIRGKSR